MIWRACSSPKFDRICPRERYSELTRTTRDEPDYDKLMKWRLGVLREHGTGLKEIQETIARIDPLPGQKNSSTS